MYEHCFNMLHLSVRARLTETQTTVSGFSGEQVKPLGKIKLDIGFEGDDLCRREIMKFTVISASSLYNIILGRPGLKQLRAIPSTIQRMMKFPTPWGITTIVSQAAAVFECRKVGKKQVVEPIKEVKSRREDTPTDQVLVNPAYLKQLVTIEKSRPVTKEVAEWLKAGIICPVKYPTWISNPILVKKGDGSWRMCIDFKNINSACPKDYYPLLEIDLKIESVIGFPLKCFLDAYKGYHQLQMAEEDEKKPPSIRIKAHIVIQRCRSA
ncbi:hypothetical protein Tco_0670898 [Tanacetum coccineum]